jgi:ribonuclease HI
MARILYTDGACSDNGKKTACGGWSFLEIRIDNEGKEYLYHLHSEGELPKDDIVPPTSIRMELKAAINALRYITTPQEIHLHSDSAYVVNGINDKWYKNWNLYDDQPFKKTPMNLDLWRELVELIQFHGEDNVKAIHVSGHKGHRWQELCDSMARQKASEAKLRR